MSVMTRAQARQGRSSARAGSSAVPRRIAELVVLGIGLLAALVTMGGYTLVTNQLDQAGFIEIVAPVLLGEGSAADPAQTYEAGRTLAAWFGASLVVMLLLSAIGIAHMRSRPHRRTPGWWFLAVGLICLLGSQLVLFPVAFVFFVVAGLFALRPLSERSLR